MSVLACLISLLFSAHLRTDDIAPLIAELNKAYEDREARNVDPYCSLLDGDNRPAECDEYVAGKESAYDDAKQKDIIGYVGLGVGGALIVTGVVFLLTGEDADRFGSLLPERAPRRLQLTWLGGPDQLGVGLHGSF